MTQKYKFTNKDRLKAVEASWNDVPCPFCSKLILNKGSQKSHNLRCKLNPNRIQFRQSKRTCYSKDPTKTVWNKGLKTSQETKDKISKALKNKNWITTPEKEVIRRKKLSDIAKNRKLGGYKQGSGRGKKGWYKSFWCDSQWELSFIIYCLDHKIDIKRNSLRFEYIYEDKKHYYIPDFIINNTLIEIKGFHTELVDVKAKAVDKPLIILYKKDLEPVFEYIYKTYGKKEDCVFELYNS